MRSVTLKIRYAGVYRTTRGKTMPTPLAAITDLEVIVSLLAPSFRPERAFACSRLTVLAGGASLRN